MGRKQAFSGRALARVLALAAAVALGGAVAALVSCAPVGSAGSPVQLPNAVEVGRLFVDYPDELALHAEPQTSGAVTDGGTYYVTTAVLANQDYTFVVAVSEYEGIDFETVQGYLQNAEGEMREHAGELENIWGAPSSLAESLAWDEPEPLVLAGHEALKWGWRNTADPSGAYTMGYCINLGDNDVGVIASSCIGNHSTETSGIFDGIVASITVS